MPKGIKGCSSDSQQDNRRSTVLMGAAPAKLLQAVSTRKKPRTLEPGRNLRRHSLLRELDCGRKKPRALWGPKSLVSEPGEPVCWEEAFPDQGWTGAKGISGQRECPSLPQVQLAPGHRAQAGGHGGRWWQRRARLGCAQTRTAGAPGAGHGARSASPGGSFEAGEGSTFPVELISAVSGTLWYPSHSSSTFLPLEMPASGRALLGKAPELRVCATSMQHCKW